MTTTAAAMRGAPGACINGDEAATPPLLEGRQSKGWGVFHSAARPWDDLIVDRRTRRAFSWKPPMRRPSAASTQPH
jgi:hypothetical protein